MSGEFFLPDTVTVEIAFSTDPLATPTWTDVSAYVRSLSVQRGRSHQLDKTEAGTATVVFDNNDRRFEPEFSSGAYHPDVLPMKRLRIRVTEDASTYDIFDGYVERWPVGYDNDGFDAHVSVTAVDAMVWLSILRFPSYPPLVEGDTDLRAYFRLGDGPDAFEDLTGSFADGSGNNMADASGLLHDAVDDGAASFNGSSAHIGMVTGLGFTGSGSFTVEAIIQTSASTGTVWGQSEEIGSDAYPSFAGLSSGSLALSTRTSTDATQNLVGSVAVDDGEVHHVAFVRDASAGEFLLYVDGVLDDSATKTIHDLQTPADVSVGSRRQGSGGISRVGYFSGTIDEFAMYDAALSAATIADHAERVDPEPGVQKSGARIGEVLDFISWPAADRDLDTGDRDIQDFNFLTQDPRQHIEDVTLTERGFFYVSADGKFTLIDRTALAAQSSSDTFGDDGSEKRYKDLTLSFDVDRIRNDVRLSVRDGGTHLAEDATSITAYGRRTFTLDTMHDSPSEALTDARAIRDDGADPLLRVDSIVIDPSGQWAAVLGRELGDLITVKRRPPGGGTAISEVVRIGAVSHKASPGDGWETSWQLEAT